jgi:ribosomal protein S27AE
MKSYEIEGKCPSCGYTVDMASCVDERHKGGPRDGDVSLCFKCGEALFFVKNGDKLSFKAMTPQERKQAIASSPSFAKAIVTLGRWINDREENE